MNRWLLVVVMICGQLSLGRAEDPVADLYDPTLPGVMMGEAARATVGRIFGVEDSEADIDYHVYDMTEHAPHTSAFRSFLIPGWGQSFNRQKTKGILLFTTFLAAGYGSLHLYQQSQDSHDDYKAGGSIDSPLYDDYEHQYAQASILAGVAGFLWIYSIVDAYRNAYNPLWSHSSQFEVALGPERQEIRWKKRF